MQRATSSLRAGHPRREFLKYSLGAAAALPLAGALGGSGWSQVARAAPSSTSLSAAAAAMKGPTTWGMNTNVDVWPYYDREGGPQSAIQHIGALLMETPCRLVREQIPGPRGKDSFQWNVWFDKWVAWLAEHDCQMALELNLDHLAAPDFAYDDAWAQRVADRCRNVAKYINADPVRKRVVAWFILSNEPDLKTGLDGGFITSERLVRMHEIAWKEIKAVNPDFLIEGLTMGDGAGTGAAFPLRGFNLNTPDNKVKVEPGKAVPGLLSKDVINLGVTRFCDFVGYHSYVEVTEGNPYGARALVQNMIAANKAKGYPLRPIVNTETGFHDTQFNRIRANRTPPRGPSPGKVSPEANFKAIEHWQFLNREQLARFAVSRSIYYLFGGSPGAPWMHTVNYPASKEGPLYSKRKCFDTMVAALMPKPLDTLNGGFEEPEDKYSNWIVHFDPHDFHSDDLEYGEWKETQFLHDGKHTAPGSSGKGYLRLNRGLPKLVRREIDGLQDGQEYRVSAWVKQNPGGKAALCVYGFNQDAPLETSNDATSKANDWVKLTTTFKPKKSLIGVDCWGVVSLEVDGKADSVWDDVVVEPVS